MRNQEPKPCPGIFEGIYNRKFGRMPYANKDHGVALAVDIKPAGELHVLAFPLACVPSMDQLPRTLRNKVNHVATFAGRIIKQAANPLYVGLLVAGHEVPHAHVHRVVGDPDADWMKRFGKVVDRLPSSGEAMDATYNTFTDPAYSALWQQLEEDIEAEGPPDELTLAALAHIAVDLSARP